MFGGRDGIRDLSAIRSAIGRPYIGYNRRVYDKAAALTESLVGNHGFVDGNKRTTFLVIDLFLDRSNYRLRGPRYRSNRRLEGLILAVAEGELNFPAISDWYRREIVKA